MTTIGTTTKAVAAATVAAGLSIAGMAGAGSASADEDLYVYALAAAPTPLDGPELDNMAALLNWGYQTCSLWYDNDRWDRATMVDRVYSGSGADIDYEEAEYIVDSAINSLCGDVGQH